MALISCRQTTSACWRTIASCCSRRLISASLAATVRDYSFPATLGAGQSAEVWVKFDNLGAETWKAGEVWLRSNSTTGACLGTSTVNSTALVVSEPTTTTTEPVETTTTLPELPERSEVSVVVVNGANIGGIAGDTADQLLEQPELAPDLCLVYLPSLDYDLQRYGVTHRSTVIGPATVRSASRVSLR